MTMEMLLLSVCLYKSKSATPIPSREEIWADRTDRRLNWLISTSVLPIYRRLPFFITCSSSAAVAAGIQMSTKSGCVSRRLASSTESGMTNWWRGQNTTRELQALIICSDVETKCEATWDPDCDIETMSNRCLFMVAPRKRERIIINTE